MKVQLQSRRDTGRFVMALGVMAIIAVMSTVFAASFIVRSVEVSIMPEGLSLSFRAYQIW